MATILDTQKQNASLLVPTLSDPKFVYGPNLRAPISIDFESVFEKLECSLTSNSDAISITAPKEVIVTTLSKMDENFIKQYVFGLISYKENKILAKHYATIKDSTVIIIPEDVQCDNVVRIDTHHSKFAIANSIIIVASKNSNVTIIENVRSNGSNKFQSKTIQVYLKENANLTYYSVDESHKDTHKFTTKRSIGLKDSKITFVDVLLGSKFHQLLLNSNLSESGTVAKMFTIYHGNENQVFDIDTTTVQSAEHTNSKIVSRGVLDDNSKAVYRGKISIEKNGKNSIGLQHNQTILLGDNSSCDAVPILDVIPSSVQCSHGVAIGRIDKMSLFYFNSRGIDDVKARQTIVEGILYSLLDTKELYEMNESKVLINTNVINETIKSIDTIKEKISQKIFGGLV